MRYFLHGMFRDTKFWKNLPLAILAILALIDLNFPIIFRYVLFKVSAVFFIIYFIIQFRKNKKRNKKLKHLKEEIPVFEEQRKKEFLEKIKENPEFKTHGFTCQYFDSKLKGCSLNLFRRKKYFKFNLEDKISYCFYWNMTSRPDILQDVE
jgi:predicted membrane protein